MLRRLNYTFNIKNKCQEVMEHEITSLLEFLYVLCEKNRLNLPNDNNDNSNGSGNCINDNINCIDADKIHQKVIIAQSQNFSIVNTHSTINSEKKNDNERRDKANEDNNDENRGSLINNKSNTILDNQILIGNNKMIKDAITINNIQHEFYYHKFFKPTPPVFSCDINAKLYSKVNLFNSIIHKRIGLRMNEDYILYSSEEDKALAQKRIEKEEFVIEVLYENNFIKENQKSSQYFNNIFLPNAYDGIFIAELINTLEGKKDRLIRGIFTETYIKKHITLNYKKIFNHLLQTDSFKSEFLFQNEEVFRKDKDRLFDFIYEIVLFYLKNRQALFNKMKLSKQMGKKAYRRAFTNYNSDNSYYDMNTINKNYTSFVHNETTNSLLSKKLLDKNHESLSLSNVQTQGKEEKPKSSIDQNEKKRKCFIINSRINIENKKTNSNVVKLTPKQQNDIIDIKVWLKEIGVNINMDFNAKEMEEIKDGILLYKIISQLEVNLSILPKINCHPLSPANAVNNMKTIIQFLSLHKKTFPIEFLNKERELYEAKPEFVLQFLMCLKRIYQNEKQFFDTISNKSRLGTSFSLSKSFNNYSIKQIITNGKDQSQRKATPLTKSVRKKFIMVPRLFWAYTMIEKECQETCEKCIQYTSPTGEIGYRCNDDISKSKVVIIVSSVFGGIGLIIMIYVTIFLILKCKRKKKEKVMKINHMTPGFQTYFDLQDKAKLEPNKEKEKSISIDSKEIEALPIQQRIEHVASEHSNKIIIYSINNSNMNLNLKTKSKLLLNTMMPQNKRWNYQVNSPSPKNKKKLDKSLSPRKKNIPRDRRKSHFFENNKIGRIVDNIMQNSKKQ